jgi:hypothetical protein
MGLIGKGTEGLKSGGSNIYFQPNKDGSANRVWVIAPDFDHIFNVPKVGVFKPKGPMNASWVYTGKGDAADTLGLKPSSKVFLWVAVKEGDDYVPKLWETTASTLSIIGTQVNEFGFTLKGLMIVVKKEGNRWNVQAAAAPKNVAVKPEKLDELWAQVKEMGLDGSDEDKLLEKMGYVPLARQRNWLIERGQFANWNTLLKAFGLPPEATDVEDFDE